MVPHATSHDSEPRSQASELELSSRRTGARVSMALAGIAALLLQGCATYPLSDPAISIFELNDGRVQRVEAPAGAPIWRPAGDVIAWASEAGVYRMPLPEGPPTLLTSSIAAGRPAWSPDGEEIAFVDRETESLTVVDADSGAVRIAIDVDSVDAVHRPLALPVLGGPAWSPDGSRLAFNCWDGSGDEICLVRADGTGLRQVTDIKPRRDAGDPMPDSQTYAVANAGPPAWSPDGRNLAVATYPEQRGAPAGVFLVDLERGSARRVSPQLPNSAISWSQDGESLLFSATERGRSDVFRVPVAGGEPVKLTARLERGGREPTEDVAQGRLAVVSGTGIVVLNPAGDTLKTIDAKLDLRSPAWSPDGSSIAYVARPNVIENYP